MNVELQRQHEAHKARQARINRNMVGCRAIPSPVVFGAAQLSALPKPPLVDWRTFETDFDSHVVAWRQRNQPLWRVILSAVSETTGVTVKEMLAVTRLKQVVAARHVAMLLLVDDAGMSLPEVGRRLGGKDHTTVMHGIRKMRVMLDADADLADEVSKARRRFAGKLQSRRLRTAQVSP